MTTTDWIIDVALVAIVIRQLREGRIDLAFVAVPAALVTFTLIHFVHGIPTAGNDLLLVGSCIAAGVLLGLAGGAALGRCSATHQITGADVWQTALVLLALSEVVVRLAVIVARGLRGRSGSSGNVLAGA